MLGVPIQALFGQLLIGLINGAFYARLRLGLAVIFGLLDIIDFTHGARYMMGAFVACFVLQYAGLGYWWALVVAPVAVGHPEASTTVIFVVMALVPLVKPAGLFGRV